MIGPIRQKIVDDLIRQASMLWIVEEAGIRGMSRQPAHTHPRMAIMYVLRERLGWTLTEIGDALHRDHSTVHNAYKNIGEWIKSDADLAELVYLLADVLPEPSLVVKDGSTLDRLARGVENLGAAMMVTLDAREREARAYQALIVEQRKTIRDLMAMAKSLSASVDAVRRRKPTSEARSAVA